MRTISEFMTAAPVPIDADHSLAEALRRMAQLELHHLPVVDGDKLTGMLSEIQILRFHRRRPEVDLEQATAEQAMAAPFAVAADSPAAEIARALLERRVDAAVIMDGGRIAGIFTATDALRAMVEIGDLRPREGRPVAWPARILCPVDFSSGSREAARTALALATSSGGSVTLFHAFDLPMAVATDVPLTGAAALEKMEREADAMLRGWRTELSPAGRPPIDVARGLGAAAECIIRQAKEHRFDAIVIGTHGRTGLRRALIGSVAENVARHAPCPVLVVRQKESA